MKIKEIDMIIVVVVFLGIFYLNFSVSKISRTTLTVFEVGKKRG